MCVISMQTQPKQTLQKGKTMSSKYKNKIPSDKDLEKACQNSYSNKREDKKLNGTNYFDSYHFESGLDADVYYNDECLVVAGSVQ